MGYERKLRKAKERLDRLGVVVINIAFERPEDKAFWHYLDQICRVYFTHNGDSLTHMGVKWDHDTRVVDKNASVLYVLQNIEDRLTERKVLIGDTNDR